MLCEIIFLLILQVRSQIAPNIQQPDPTKFYSGRLTYYTLPEIKHQTFSFNYPASFNSSEPPPQLVLSLVSLNHVSDITNFHRYNGYLLQAFTISSTVVQISFYSFRPTFIRRIGYYYLFVSSSYSSSFYSNIIYQDMHVDISSTASRNFNR